jgi:hypothetical protein
VKLRDNKEKKKGKKIIQIEENGTKKLSKGRLAGPPANCRPSHATTCLISLYVIVMTIEVAQSRNHFELHKHSGVFSPFLD